MIGPVEVPTIDGGKETVSRLHAWVHGYPVDLSDAERLEAVKGYQAGSYGPHSGTCGCGNCPAGAVVRKHEPRADKPVFQGNNCRICGERIPPSGKAGRPRTAHQTCQDEDGKGLVNWNSTEGEDGMVELHPQGWILPIENP